jgi:colanic acid biosynthesis glycosyl transferase WcaI
MIDRKPIKLLVVTMLYEPDCVGIAAIASDMCAGLAERGNDVTVYTTYPYYPEWTLKRDVNSWRVQQESIANVDVRRFGLFVPSNPSRLLPRLLHELSFPLSLMRSLFHCQRFDVVMVFCPLLGSVAFAAVRKLFYREPLWVNIQDIPAEASRASGINRSKAFHYLGSFAQKYLFNRGEVWSSISPGMVTQLEAIKEEKTTVHLFPNWLTRSLYTHVRQLPRKVGRQPRKTVKLLYCGTIGKKQGLRKFCQAISSYDFDFHFRIHGEGGAAAEVRNWVKRSGDTRFEFSGLLPEADFVRAIHDADWFVISEKQGAGFSFLPSKLIPCISVGTPVLAISDSTSPLGREVSNNGIGISLEWSQLDELPGQVIELGQAPERFTRLQESCLSHAKVYCREEAIDRMEKSLLAFASNRHMNNGQVPHHGQRNGHNGPT